jgi:hypothetical protein
MNMKKDSTVDVEFEEWYWEKSLKSENMYKGKQEKEKKVTENIPG